MFDQRSVVLIEVAIVHLCPIGIELVSSQRCQEGFEREDAFLLRAPPDIREDDASWMINGMPEPSLLAFRLHDTPQLIALRFCHWLDLNTDLARLQVWDGQIVAVLELRRFLFTRQSRWWDSWAGHGQESRMPRPFQVISAFAG